MRTTLADSGTAQSQGGKGDWLSHRGKSVLVVLMAAAVVVLVVGFLAYGYNLLGTGPPTTTTSTNSTSGVPGFMQATCSTLPTGTTGTVEHDVSGGSGNHAYFLIVEADPPSAFAGINGSYYVGPTTQWPTMNVKVGQAVSIHVINCASSESHGFQVQHYDDISKNLIAIGPGQSYDVTFTANQAGTFRVYCGIFCSIHPLMQNGALVVS